MCLGLLVYLHTCSVIISTVNEYIFIPLTVYSEEKESNVMAKLYSNMALKTK